MRVFFKDKSWEIFNLEGRENYFNCSLNSKKENFNLLFFVLIFIVYLKINKMVYFFLVLFLELFLVDII